VTPSWGSERLHTLTLTPPDRAAPDDADPLRLLVRAVDEYAIFPLAPDGTVMTWNPGAERLNGYAGPDIVDRHFGVFSPPGDVAAGKPGRELDIAKHDGFFIGGGWRVRKDSTRCWAHVVITALYDGPTLRGFAKVTATKLPLGPSSKLAWRSAPSPRRCRPTPASTARSPWSPHTPDTSPEQDEPGWSPGGKRLYRLGGGRSTARTASRSAAPRRPNNFRRHDGWGGRSGHELPAASRPGSARRRTSRPMVAGTGVTGVLVAAAPSGTTPFRQIDLEQLQKFADQATLVLSYELAQQALRGKELADDRERIAGDLHDEVSNNCSAPPWGCKAPPGAPQMTTYELESTRPSTTSTSPSGKSAPRSSTFISRSSAHRIASVPTSPVWCATLPGA
jgi:hypothetical protein